MYTKSEYTDFFATSVLLIISTVASLSVVFYYQFMNGSLPWWLIFCYYFAWVGTGGRIMGAAYALAHKEVRVFVILFCIVTYSLLFCMLGPQSWTLSKMD